MPSRKPAASKPSKPRTSKSPAPRRAKPAATPSKNPKSNRLADPILKARYEAELSRYRKARGGELAGWDERYEAFGEILENQLYLAAGFKSEGAFLAAEAPDQDARTVKQYIRVAQHFEPEDEAKYGVSRLDALLDYLAASGGLGDGVKVHPERQKVRLPGAGKGAPARAVPLADVSVADLRAATRTARAGSGQSGRTASPVEKSLRALLSKAGLVRARGEAGRPRNKRDVPATKRLVNHTSHNAIFNRSARISKSS